MTDNLVSFSMKDVNNLVDDYYAFSDTHYHAQSCPRAILLAGQPGAGKTELSSMFIKSLDRDAAFLNGDDFRRFHPHYKDLFVGYGSDAVQMISPFSNAVVNLLIERFSNRHFNLVIEGTGRTVEVPQHTAETLTTKGYSVELAVLATRPIISLVSTMRRFYKMNENGTVPRATAISSHDSVVDALPANLDALTKVPEFVRITIYNRDLDLLFDSTNDVSSPSAILLHDWNKPWSESEIESVKNQISGLRRCEELSRLGQEKVIDEIECRFIKAIS